MVEDEEHFPSFEEFSDEVVTEDLDRGHNAGDKTRRQEVRRVVDTELHRNYEKLRAVYELSRAIGTAQDIDVLLERTVDTAFGLLAADRAAILLVDQNTGKPVPRITRQRSGNKREEIVLSSTIINEVVSTKSGLVLTDTGQNEQFATAQSIMSQGIRSAMCVPMMYGGELLGLIHLDSLIATNVFSEKDLSLFTSIGSHAAMAIKNLLMSERLQNEAKARIKFQRFLPPSLVEQVIRGELEFGKSGELRQITV
ncbi:MAG: GAF domain-containing protein, partial [Myxococcota bacterium]